MSASFAVFDAVVAHLVQRLAPRRALDVGAGQGKYGRMLAAQAPGCHRVAVELQAAHAAQFGLAQLYNEVHVADVARWWPQQPLHGFDLVILGDCLGQMSKSQGTDLLNALVCQCAWVVLVAPEFAPTPADSAAPQAPSEAPDPDAATAPPAALPQRAVWTERDLHWHDLWAWDNCRATTLAVLRGHGRSQLSLSGWVAEANAACLPVLHFDGHTVVRPAHLRTVHHAREVDYRLP